MGVKKIILVAPSLSAAGGIERVVTQIGNNFSQKDNVEVHIVSLLNDSVIYSINDEVSLHMPSFKESNPILRQIKTMRFFRSKVLEIRPDVVVSFGSMYNSFVMMACLGLEKKIRFFLSDRSNPYRNTYFTFKRGGDERHDGVHHFLLKQIFYRRAHGILVQTRLSYEIEKKTLRHKNLVYFPNPVKKMNFDNSVVKENIILNVGRFIPSKQQLELIKIFNSINDKDWKLYLAGDGPNLDKVKQYVVDKAIDNVVFLGNVSNIREYYQKSKIFAFTSRTEGFPNALAEALTVPLAAISYDCVAGPADLIIDNYNGYLVPLDNRALFKEKLTVLMNDEAKRNEFGHNSLLHMKQYDQNVILDSLFETVFKGL